MTEKKIDNKWKTAEPSIERIKPAKKNANRMEKEDFDKLKSNIEKSGLSSTIACYKKKETGDYIIISGHHRHKACTLLGFNKMPILYANEEDLSRDEIIAIQLSHNSLHGSDDKGILKKLFDEIEGIDFKNFAHISMDDLNAGDLFIGSIVPVSEHFTVTLVLYKQDMNILNELLGIVEEKNDTSDMVIVADGKDCEGLFLDAITKAKKEFEITSTSVAFGKILQIANDNLVTGVTETGEKTA